MSAIQPAVWAGCGQPRPLQCLELAGSNLAMHLVHRQALAGVVLGGDEWSWIDVSGRHGRVREVALWRVRQWATGGGHRVSPEYRNQVGEVEEAAWQQQVVNSIFRPHDVRTGQ